MLPRRHRLTRPEDFRAVTRSGARCGNRLVVVHVSQRPPARLADPSAVARRPPRVGLVVGRTVGSAVTRNQVARRLRAHLGARVGDLPEGLDVVIRALPPAAEATWSELTSLTDRCLDKAVVRMGQLSGTVPRSIP